MNETRATQMSCPIVGAHYRPPAKAILSEITANTSLSLVPEPDNAYDPNAIKVEISVGELRNQRSRSELAIACSQFGYDFNEILSLRDDETLHLGYIPRTIAKTLSFDTPRSARFRRDLSGAPTVVFEADS